MFEIASNQRRNEYLDLCSFVEKTDRDITDAATALGWTVESVTTDNDHRLVCPYDPSHRIGGKILDRHLESCQWKREGYDKLDTPLPESALPIDSYCTIKLDAATQNDILREARRRDPAMKTGSGERLIPQTSDRIFTDFTADERKVLYAYVVSNTIKTEIGQDITDIQKPKTEAKEDEGPSFLELLIQERNLKRRRAKHRGVHTNKKSHTEILREVIHQQMELYTDCIADPRPVDESRKAPAPADNQSSTRNFKDSRFSSASTNGLYPPSSHRDLPAEEPHKYHESSRSRSTDPKRKCSDKSRGFYKDQRDKRSHRTTDPWKIHKHHKRKRSRSAERGRSKRDDYESTEMAYKTKKEQKMKRKRESSE